VNRKTLFRRAAVAATTLATVTTLTASAFAQPGQPADAAPNGPAGGPWQHMMMMRHGKGMAGMEGMAGMPRIQIMRNVRRMHGGGGMVEHLLANATEIGLTDAQQDQLRQVRRRAPGLLMPKRQAVVEAQLDFHDLTEKTKASSAELRSAHDKVLKARNELAAAMFDLHLQVRDVLTPEQRDKIHGAMREHLRHGDGPEMKKSGGGGHGDMFDSGNNDNGDDDDDDDGGDGAASQF
jgi:Spy/CpxP family protein refolding chaperone